MSQPLAKSNISKLNCKTNKKKTVKKCCSVIVLPKMHRLRSIMMEIASTVAVQAITTCRMVARIKSIIVKKAEKELKRIHQS